MKFFGPKIIFCGVFISLWGFFQLLIMGIGYYFHAITLSEDIFLDTIIEGSKTIPELYEQINKNFALNLNAYQCWLAAGLYAVLLAFFVYIYFNKNKRA